MIEIDGSIGEGGGQIVRSALALSLATGQSFSLRRVRAKRQRPGLRAQHLTAVHAAARIGSAHVEGDELGSGELLFEPSAVQHGDHRFSVGTAGSATLVLQTVVLPLLMTPGQSRLVLEGGTHNPLAPTFEFLDRAFLPVLRRMGASVEAKLERVGFAPAGGGRLTVELRGRPRLEPLRLLERGEVVSTRARALVARLPRTIAERELAVVGRELGWTDLEAHEIESDGPGNVLTLELESEHITELVTGFGERGVRAEKVARRAIRAMQRHVDGEAPVGHHLADQLLLPCALAKGGSYCATEVTEHTRTNAAVIELFSGVAFDMEKLGSCWRVGVRG